MIWALLSFYVNLLSQTLLAGHYREELIIDDEHPHYRRFTKHYLKKRGLVKNCWIAAGLLALIFPLPHIAVTLTLLTTFVSFSILDETE